MVKEDSNTSVDYSAMYPGETPDEELNEETPAETLDEADPNESYVEVNAHSLNLREADSMESNVVDILKKNKKLRVIDDSNPEWNFVEVDGKIGYVKKSFTTKV